ncbi:hypothetical protein [Flavobacterium sp.]|jgi:hypothetical protein|uniref:hypothetical protein n=1 Tax=Flavobacterium sp. TaxID=239 RepID=UPI0037BFDA32
MKKRLESELISIAHRILKLKNKSEVDQLYKESQKLYETLLVLKFYQDNFESVKSDVDEVVLEEKLKQSLEVEIAPAIAAEVNEEDVEPIAEVEAAPEIEEGVEEQIETEEDPSDSELAEQSIVSEAPEEVIEEQSIDEEEPIGNEESAFKPIFELETEEEEQEQQDIPAEVAFESQPEEKLEDHIGKYTEPVFVKTNEVSLFTSDSSETEEAKQTVAEEVKEEPKSDAFNEMTTKSIAIGLNDRIGFVQHLFNDSNEDFNRVISQLNTFDTFEEAKNFINEMVLPDYNYWVGEEDYIERFMEIVEKKFS